MELQLYSAGDKRGSIYEDHLFPPGKIETETDSHSKNKSSSRIPKIKKGDEKCRKKEKVGR